MDFAYRNMIARNFIRLNHKQQCEILAVRNIESVRKFMLDSKIISEKEHFRFIESLKEAKNMAYFGVYECENNKNSSLGETFRPFENFEHSQTHSLASHSKFAKNSTSKTADTRIFSNANDAESRRSERAESAESFKDSNILDCHAHPYGLSRNDGIGVDCHEFNKLNSRNDDSSLTVFVRKSAGLTKQSIYDSTENDFKDSIDCLVPNWLCNYDSMAIPYNADSRNDDSLSSLRGSEATEAIHLNSFCNSDSKNIIHSHDSITQNLALITKNASIKSQESSLQNDNSQLTLLGVVCFNHIDFANKNAFFGIYSIPDKKNGANLLAMLEFIAFEVLNLHALYAKVLSTNARALNFYAKHNFTHCGKMPNAIRRDGGFLDIEILAKFKEQV